MEPFWSQSILSEDLMRYFIVIAFIVFLLSSFLLLLFTFGSHIALHLSTSFQVPFSIFILLSILQALLYFLSLLFFSYANYLELISSLIIVSQILLYIIILLPSILFLEFRKSSDKIKKAGNAISSVLLSILGELEEEPTPITLKSFFSILKKTYMLAFGLRKVPAYTLWVKEGGERIEDEKAGLMKNFNGLMIKVLLLGFFFYGITGVRVALIASRNLDYPVVELIYGVIRIIFGLGIGLWLFRQAHSMRRFLKRQNYLLHAFILVVPTFIFHVEKSIIEMICFFAEDNVSEKHDLGAIWTYFLLSMKCLPLAVLMLRTFSTEGIHLEEYKEFLKPEEKENQLEIEENEGQEKLLNSNENVQIYKSNSFNKSN